jgi:site-specific DNA-methyltransferase (adenine-specific)
MNALYYGDNLDVLRRYVADESVDLVYLDPPFKSNQDYNVLFAEHGGTKAAAQIKAFEDTWRWDQASAKAFEETVEGGGAVSLAMQAFRTFLGTSDMLAYLAMMAPRLVELHRVLKPSGSIYLHCDATASHYLKLLMDAVFGPRNYRNELVWHYKKFQKRDMRKFVKNSDRLLFYVKNAKAPYYFEMPTVHLDAPKAYKRKTWDGELQRIVNVRDADGKLIYDSHEEEKVDDVWELPFIGATAKERQGYPTQKPQALLERIVAASSKEGDVVLDPFCGCGTAVAAAQNLNRAWIGIDVTHLAVGLIKNRLRDEFGDAIGDSYKVIGEPTTTEDAEALADTDPYQFQWWALGLVGARPAEQKKGADKGIDGRLFFHDEKRGETKQVILSVKAGKLHATHVRDLRGVVDRETAAIGVLISLEEPTQQMRAEAATAGFYTAPFAGTKHPRLQIITVGALLDGRGIDYPGTRQLNVTMKRAARAKGEAKPSRGLF